MEPVASSINILKCKMHDTSQNDVSHGISHSVTTTVNRMETELCIITYDTPTYSNYTNTNDIIFYLSLNY